ncbi:hypothetical protein SLE2022_057040 [Rubroshorea leprosula]
MSLYLVSNGDENRFQRQRVDIEMLDFRALPADCGHDLPNQASRRLQIATSFHLLQLLPQKTYFYYISLFGWKELEGKERRIR